MRKSWVRVVNRGCWQWVPVISAIVRDAGDACASLVGAQRLGQTPTPVGPPPLLMFLVMVSSLPGWAQGPSEKFLRSRVGVMHKSLWKWSLSVRQVGQCPLSGLV